MSENIREIVFDCLMLIDGEDRKSHLVLREVLDKYDYLDERDKNFIKRLTEGTIQSRITLDYAIDCVADKPVAGCKPEIKEILRMAAYQILYMDRVPVSAAIDEAVKLTERKSRREFKGFVNAVLRRLSENGMPDIDSIEDKTIRLSVKYSIPEWMVRMILKEQHAGEDLIRELVKERPTTVRIRFPERKEEITGKWREAGVEYEATGLIDNTFYVNNFHGADGLYGFTEGMVYIQDLSSQLSVYEGAREFKDQTIKAIDLCAAPGGKSIFLSELLGPKSRITACDVSSEKVELINDNLERLKIKNIETMINDASSDNPGFYEAFDLVICDVPCSGLGVISRKSDLKYRVSNESMISLCALQRQIMECAVKYVKKGGKLIYSTCTIHKAENEKMAAYIEKVSDLSLVFMRQLRPDRDGTDGFFTAVFERK